jgi:hypothetical protein
VNTFQSPFHATIAEPEDGDKSPVSETSFLNKKNRTMDNAKQLSLVILFSEYVAADLCFREPRGWRHDMISTLEIVL